MYFSDAVRVIIKRWYVVLPVLLLTGLTGFVVVQGTPPSFEATGSVVFVGPVADTKIGAGGSNPLNTLDVATVVHNVLTQTAVKRQLVAGGVSPNYLLSIPQGDNSPLVEFTVTAHSPEAAVSSVQGLINAARLQADETQRRAGAPQGTWVRVLPVTVLPAANRLVGAKIKALVAFGAIGVMGAFSLAFLVEGAQASRRRPKVLPAMLPAARYPDDSEGGSGAIVAYQPVGLRLTSGSGHDRGQLGSRPKRARRDPSAGGRADGGEESDGGVVG